MRVDTIFVLSSNLYVYLFVFGVTILTEKTGKILFLMALNIAHTEESAVVVKIIDVFDFQGSIIPDFEVEILLNVDRVAVL